MNVVLNVDEVEAVLSLVTSQVLDGVELSPKAQEAIRQWRTNRAPDTVELDGYAGRLNEAIGNAIDERTTRMLRQRGRYVRESERRLS